MSAPSHAPVSKYRWSDIHRDSIEQQIVRAYVQLTVSAGGNDPLRTLILTRFGSVEIRLTKTRFPDLPSVPPYWQEIYSHLSGTTVDSLGCFGFGEDELDEAVDFVCAAEHLHQTRQ